MTRRRFVVLLLVMLAVVVLSACDEGFLDAGVQGSGNLVTESRDVGGFDEILLLSSGDVVVTIGASEALTIEAEDNIMPLLTTEVRNGRLELGSEDNFSTTERITYTITATTLEGVQINGSGDIDVVDLDASTFEVTINGSGDVGVAGATGRLTVEINGSGDFNGESLSAQEGAVEVAGSGSVLVNVTDVLDVAIAGSGDVTYIGDPRVNEDISGSGEVSER